MKQSCRAFSSLTAEVVKTLMRPTVCLLTCGLLVLGLIAGDTSIRAESVGETADTDAMNSLRARVVEFAIPYSRKGQAALSHQACMPGMSSRSGSTHEIAFDPRNSDILWITGQNYDTLVKVRTNGEMKLIPLPAQRPARHRLRFRRASLGHA